MVTGNSECVLLFIKLILGNRYGLAVSSQASTVSEIHRRTSSRGGEGLWPRCRRAPPAISRGLHGFSAVVLFCFFPKKKTRENLRLPFDVTVPTGGQGEEVCCYSGRSDVPVSHGLFLFFFFVCLLL